MSLQEPALKVCFLRVVSCVKPFLSKTIRTVEFLELVSAMIRMMSFCTCVFCWPLEWYHSWIFDVREYWVHAYYQVPRAQR